jgi:hypothetical protein
VELEPLLLLGAGLLIAELSELVLERLALMVELTQLHCELEPLSSALIDKASEELSVEAPSRDLAARRLYAHLSARREGAEPPLNPLALSLELGELGLERLTLGALLS